MTFMQTLIATWAVIGLAVAVWDIKKDFKDIEKLLMNDPMPPWILAFCAAVGVMLGLAFNLLAWPITVYVRAKRKKS